MVSIRKLVWDSWNVSHIARHHVMPDEVEAICHGLPIVLRGQQKNRLLLVGPTEEKRMLTVILEPIRKWNILSNYGLSGRQSRYFTLYAHDGRC